MQRGRRTGSYVLFSGEFGTGDSIVAGAFIAVKKCGKRIGKKEKNGGELMNDEQPWQPILPLVHFWEDFGFWK